MNSKWMVYAKKADFKQIASEYGIDQVLARIIRNRDICGSKDIDMYLNGNLNDIHNPHSMKDADKFVDIITKKIEEHKPVRIIGDYDIDGICSIYILFCGLKAAGADVDYVVPHRINDGYGINEHLIDNAINEGIDTIVTCDNGIAAYNEITMAKEKGMTVIITDHHEIPYKETEDGRKLILPPADAIVNPKQPDCNYPEKRLCGAVVALKLVTALYEACGIPEKELEDFLEEEADGEVHEKLLEFYFEVSKFLNIYDLVDDHYVIYTYYAPDGSFLVRLYCVDTSANIQKCLDKANAAVFFSATLLPVQYYISLLSEAKDDYAIYARSPFDPKNRAVLIGTDVSSRYTRRGQEEYMRIAAYIKQTVMQKKGNYLAFFPSYRMLQDVMECTGPQLDTSIRCICQTSGMTEEEREAFLHEFEQKRKEDEGLLGFCVMGGIFGEGIDLKEDSLIGAIIVGTGIPQICREREILKQYYDGRNEDGFAYAYRYPGMNKVLQSAGRVIRTAQDRGVVLLLDERFAKSEYRKMFPREWEECEYCSRSNVADKLGRFWELSEYEH